MSMGARIAGNCHVGDSNFKVIRTVYYKILKKQRRDTSLLFRNMRKSVYRDALKAHKANQEMFYDIARGNIGNRRRRG